VEASGGEEESGKEVAKRGEERYTQEELVCDVQERYIRAWDHISVVSPPPIDSVCQVQNQWAARQLKGPLNNPGQTPGEGSKRTGRSIASQGP
jgi:hypothetical protein